MRTIIVRRGVGKFKYAVYTITGAFLFNANSMKEIRDWYGWEIRHGSIDIKRERRN